MKKLIPIFFLFVLVACHKKYEEKVDSYTGTQLVVDMETETEDTLSFEVDFDASYSLSYDKKAKSYRWSASSGIVPSQSFDRKNFYETNKATGSGVSFSGADTWELELIGDSAYASYIMYSAGTVRVIGFEGKK